MKEAQIDEIIKKRRIIITCGTGGVGKTTLSAAIAVRAALLGKKAVVITIDPAKRLATSLGLTQLGDEPTDLTDRVRTVAGDVKGTLHAIIPESEKTFELFIRELSSKEELIQRVLRNPVFQIVSKEYSGANEYMALERLHALHRNNQYDCIILDTPPSRNTMAFLDAPKLLARLFEERLIRWLVIPTNKLLAAGMRKALGLLERLTGQGFMVNLVDFASALFEVQDAFTKNLKSITALLESDAVGFIMVTAPSPNASSEVEYFIDRIGQHGFNFDGIALNRTLSYLKGGPEEDSAGPELREAIELLKALQSREENSMKQMKRKVLAKLPELSRDVHSVEDLFHVAQAFES